MSTINPLSPNSSSAALANQVAAANNSNSSSSVSSASSSVSSNSVYYAGEDDLSSIAVQAGAGSPTQTQQSSAYSQLGNSTTTPTQSLPSPMSMITQSSTHVVPTAPKTPPI